MDIRPKWTYAVRSYLRWYYALQRFSPGRIGGQFSILSSNYDGDFLQKNLTVKIHLLFSEKHSIIDV